MKKGAALFLSLIVGTASGCDLLKELQEKLLGPGGSGAGEEEDSAEIREGIELYRAGQIDAARQRFETVVQKDPGSANAFYYLGLCYLSASGDAPDPSSPFAPEEQKGLDAFNRALSLNPRHVQAAIGIGDLYSRRVPSGKKRMASKTDPSQDPYPLALEAYQRALAIDPKLPEAQHHYARFRERVGELEEAERAYKAAAEAAATVPEIAPDYYIVYGRFLAGLSGRLPEAIDQYELALMFRGEDQGLQRDIAALYGRMGQEYFKNQQFSLAEQSLNKAYALFPDKRDPEAEKAAETLRQLKIMRGR